MPGQGMKLVSGNVIGLDGRVPAAKNARVSTKAFVTSSGSSFGFRDMSAIAHPANWLSCRVCEKRIGQALRRAARGRCIALRQRCIAAIDVGASAAVGLQANREIRIVSLSSRCCRRRYPNHSDRQTRQSQSAHAFRYRLSGRLLRIERGRPPRQP